MIDLRPYQSAALDQVSEHYRNGVRRVLVCLMTGAGKTRVGTEAARRAMSKGRPVVWLAHRTELIAQAADTIRSLTGIEPGIIQGSRRPKQSLIQVASFQTLLNRRNNLPPASLLVVDEAHHALSPEYRAIVDSYGKAYHLLLSATPSRADGKPMGDMADAIVAPIQPSELVAQNALVPCEIIAPSEMVDKGLAQDPVEAYKEFASGGKAILFAQHKVQALALHERFKANQIQSVCVFDDTPWSTRQQAYDDLRKGKKSVLINIMIATEGFDMPDIDTVILARSVGHAALYVQMSGRGARPAPWANKQSYKLIDLKGSVAKFGSPEADRFYSLDGEEGITTEGNSGHGKTKECKTCFSMYTAVACPVCRAEAMSKEPEVKHVEMERKRYLAPDSNDDLYRKYIRLLDRDWSRDPQGFVKKAMADFEEETGSVARPSWGKDFANYLGRKFLTQKPPERWPMDVSHSKLMPKGYYCDKGCDARFFELMNEWMDNMSEEEWAQMHKEDMENA